MEANIESLRNLEENLAELNSSVSQIAWILFYNKRDLPMETIAPVEALDLLLLTGRQRVPRFAGSCLDGTNVFNALNDVSQRVLREFLVKDDLENYEAYR